MIREIEKRVIAQGGQLFFVGGCVRDEVMDVSIKDIDIEVFGISPAELTLILKDFGKVDLVGQSFGVIKLTTEDEDFDFSFPRRDNKVGVGHKGFEVEVDHTMTPIEAARRRDFTWNGMSMTISGEIIDPFGGIDDIKAKRIRHISESFAEDPLRVLRGFQFAGRFNMKVCNETAELCKSLKSEFHTLPKERIWEEWKKWALKSQKPSAGLKFLVDTEWVSLFPEIEFMTDWPQEPEWHPEGDVFEHTCFVVDEAARISEGLNDDSKMAAMFGALCHDMGKVVTTEKSSIGRWISHGHDIAGEPFARSFMESIGAPKQLTERVVEIVKEHMVHVHTDKPTKRFVRRFLNRLNNASFEDIMIIVEADHSGRPPLPKSIPDKMLMIRDIVEEIGAEIKPILMGRHLIDLGVKPGIEMGQFLRSAFEVQLDGYFQNEEEAIEWAKVNL